MKHHYPDCQGGPDCNCDERERCELEREGADLFPIEESKSPEIQWLEDAKATGIAVTDKPDDPPSVRYRANGCGHTAYAPTELEAVDMVCFRTEVFPTFDAWKMKKRKA